VKKKKKNILCTRIW